MEMKKLIVWRQMELNHWFQELINLSRLSFVNFANTDANNDIKALDPGFRTQLVVFGRLNGSTCLKQSFWRWVAFETRNLFVVQRLLPWSLTMTSIKKMPGHMLLKSEHKISRDVTINLSYNETCSPMSWKRLLSYFNLFNEESRIFNRFPAKEKLDETQLICFRDS